MIEWRATRLNAIRRAALLLGLQKQVDTNQSEISTAESTATNARGMASNAQSMARNAGTAAQTASDAASSASSTAAGAASMATAAKASADTAASTASTAKTTADNAVSTASTAKSAADNATTAAADAKSIAEAAKKLAEEAKTLAAKKCEKVLLGTVVVQFSELVGLAGIRQVIKDLPGAKMGDTLVCDHDVNVANYALFVCNVPSDGKVRVALSTATLNIATTNKFTLVFYAIR